MKNVFIILSGGPGEYDPKDPDSHDQSWDNFVTPPLLRSSKATLHDTKTEDVHWLVYEPAYTARWTSDVANQKTAPTQYQHTVTIKLKHKHASYLDLLKTRATERGWKYAGISSAQGFWEKTSRLSRRYPLSRRRRRTLRIDFLAATRRPSLRSGQERSMFTQKAPWGK